MSKPKKEIIERVRQTEVRAEEGGSVIDGRPIVFNSPTDIGGWFEEVIEPGALDRTDLRDVRLCLNHDTNYVYARSRRNNPNSTMRLMPNAAGLDFEANLAIEESARAKDLYTAVQRKDIDKMSFMFVIGDEEWENLDSDYPTRHIKSISTVYEISAVTFPAYEGTSLEIGARAKEALDNAWNFISTHDTPRGNTYLMGENPESSDRLWQSMQKVEGDDYKTASKMLVCAYALMFGLPGVPCIYYGDEIGMQGYRDPFNRGYFNWQQQDEYILKNINWLANFRKSHHEYREGGLFFIHVSHNAVAYVRYENEDEVLTAVNRGNGPETFSYKGKEYTIPALNYINAVIE